ncbi:MAG: hypothetical protein ACOY5B_00030 [Spirochaetota bacterium]
MQIRSLLLLVTLVSSIAAARPADRVPADTSVYIEGAPLSESLTSLRTLVANIAGEGIWSMMSANFEQRMGVNMLDPQKLEEIGIKTSEQWAVAINMEIEAAGNPSKPEFVMIFPVQSNAKFYEFLKAKITESQMPINTEVEAGRVLNFGSENDPGYLVRTDDALLVSNKKEMVMAMRSKVSSPISDAAYYTSMRSHLLSRNGKKMPLMAFYLNPKLIVSSLKAQSDLLRNLQKELNKGDETAPAIDDNSPYVAEIRENLQSSGGALVANAERVSFYFSYKYKEGYLTDTSKIYPRIIQVKTEPLASDTAARNPVNYTLIKLNVMGMIELFKSLSPVFGEKYAKAIEEANANLGMDFEAQILNSLRGNYNFQLLNIPAEEKVREVGAWELHGAFGIKPGTAKNWVRLLKASEKMAKKAEANKKQKTKFKFEEAEDGEFVSISGPGNMVNGKRQTVTVVFLIRENEVIVSNSKANALKATKGGSSTLSERLAKIPYESAQGVFFLDLQQVFKAVMKSKQGSSMKAYAPMLEKMKSFSIISTVQGDFATAETMLQMRK